MHLELIVLGLVCMFAPVTARLAGSETGRKPFDLCGAAGIFFLLASACGMETVATPAIESIARGVTLVSTLLAWLSLAIGAVWGAIDVVREPDRAVTHLRA